MKLNKDCVRSVLLFVEDKYIYGSPILINQFTEAEELKDFSRDEIEYTILKLLEAEFLSGSTEMINFQIAKFYCTGLTWRGHEFLDTVRDPEIWRQTKSAASKLASASVSMLFTLGTEFVKKKLHLS